MTAPAFDLPSNRVLHAGCGGEPLPDWIHGQETRLDIDPKLGPDVVANITDMGTVGNFDIVYCSHCLEHLHHDDVGKALKEFHRVLVPGGQAVVFVPDLEDVRPTEDVVYISEAGPITGIDMFFGMRKLSANNPHMVHRFGFIRETLKTELEKAGFQVLAVKRLSDFNLLAIGQK